MFLDSSDSIEVVLEAAVGSTEAEWTASWVDHDGSSTDQDSGDGVSTGATPVTMVAAPTGSVLRQVVGATVFNPDNGPITVVVRLNNGSTTRRIARFELMPYESVQYDGRDWYAADHAGRRQFDDRSGGVASLLNFAHVSGLGGIDANFVAGQVNGTALTTLALSTDLFTATPFVVPPRNSTLNRVAVYPTTGSGGTSVRLGIYEATSFANLYPNALLWDSGALSTASSSTIASGAPNLSLVSGRLYWAVLNSSGAPTVRALAVGGACPIFGFPDAISGTAAQIGLRGSRTYGALPSTFTASIAAATTTIPAIFLRFGA